MRTAILLIATLAGPALANEDYTACVADAALQPAQTLALAEEWRALGGGAAAGHCAALALAALDRPAEAAQRLETLAYELPDLTARADALAQAGDFWLTAGRVDAARDAFTRALSMAYAVGPLSGRARAHAAAGDWPGAEADLTSALQLAPDDGTLLSLRAAARRRMGQAAGAFADADRAIALDPGNALAWLERGSARGAYGDNEGARADWAQALRLDEAGPAGSLAAQRLGTATPR